jgi:type IV pilus assembly protein PilM
MSLVDKIRNWVEEPPPKYAFEIGPAGLAIWHQERGHQFAAIEGLDRDPDAEILAALLRRNAPAANGNKRRPAALILPDSCARLALLDFDNFPRKAEEQLALIRFRLKRSVPFDVDTAIIRYQTESKEANSVNVVAAAISIEKLAPYETAFRNAGFHPGFITLASLSMSNLAAPDTALMKLSGSHFTFSYFEGEKLRLYRGLDLESATLAEILNVVDPTIAYLEDELQRKPLRIEGCGLEDFNRELTEHFSRQWNLSYGTLRADEYNAGLYGYLASMGVQ